MGTLDSTVYALTANSSNGVLAAGGYFNGSFVEWKTPTWTTLAGLNGYVTALISDPATGHLIAGGGFSGYCAEWDGSQWTPLGTLNGRVSALAINPITGKLIAGGDFDGYCAEWNGSEWITLGLLDNSVVALSVTTNGNVIAGGYFTGYCAEWNGTEWTTLGELSSYVYALTVNTANGHVIAGGDFSGSCAEWNGSAWIPLGAVGGQVYALAVNPANGNVIAGGYFPGNGNCAEWNGSEWTTLGAFDSSVSALFVTTNGNVIAGGNFTGYCAEWNGTAWTTRGALDADVYAIAKDPVTGFVALGGNFTGYCLELGVISDPGVSPASGLVDGGYQVIISGTNLCNGTMGDVTSVTLCGVAATVTGVSGSTQIVVTAGVSGVAGLGGASVVSTSFGETVKANVFTYTEAAGLQPPIALSAIDVTTNRFTARWTASEGATNYLIDVSETNTFASHTGIYNNWNVGDATECLVTGLTDRTTYYYRLRAANSDGVSTNSNTVEVPVSDNTPYVQYERTNGVASLGSSDVIVMTNLFHGAGMSYSVVSNSNPALVTTSFTNSNLILEYTPGESGSATITVRVTDLSTGFFVETTFTVAVVSEPTWVAGPIVLNRQNGLYEQSVTVSNTSPLTAKAVTLTVTNLTAGARLYNATGADDHGNPEIQWAGTLPGHSSMVFKLQYYTARRGAVSAAVLVSLSLEDPETLVSGTEGPELKDIDIVPGAVMLEFSAVPGRTYYIRYQASDSTWKTVQPSIVAPANRVQWIDAGPPGTESAPGSVPSRNYKVIEAAR
jgi:hypothetical protein